MDVLRVDVSLFSGDPGAGMRFASKNHCYKSKVPVQPPAKAEEEPTQVTEVPPPPVSKELKRGWSYFIRKVTKQILSSTPSARGKCASSVYVKRLIM